MTKLKAFIKKVAGANGPAQILSYSFWGVLIAGMLWDFCNSCLPQPLLVVWSAASLVILASAIWCSKKTTMYALWIDMILSAVVLSIVAFHEPHITKIVYTVQDSGEFSKSHVSEVFTIIALVWTTLHGAYLANLLQRQILEAEMFNDRH